MPAKQPCRRRNRLICPSPAIINVILPYRLRNTWQAKTTNVTPEITIPAVTPAASRNNCNKATAPTPIKAVDAIAINNVPIFEGPDRTDIAIDIARRLPAD
jgi:hypothetical protein